ncbi:hypothetical protein N5U20_06660 [Aliarcobacter butzleri]|uniref:hypothetical protein n=1 Tax=Aliarcobacter butzleri TaxID=28197 RepID=UPI0021B4012A|nr:hypothetical protein [Aliarcobacter butzleri]MCT7563993.1 hypothetical protein [Aliarcobacter butzleri]MCT7612893.1 hypothetical protein [Aliarcobacter butzleri]MCT7641529.1 hypothetical protein [Aliarcobacter butzleri]
MNLISSYSNSNVSSYLNFEASNNTYSIMDFEQRDYSSILSKTDITKQLKSLIIFALALNMMNNAAYAFVEKEKIDLGYYIEQKITCNNNHLMITKNWVDEFLIDAKNLNTANKLFPYYSKINDLMIENKFESYNKILSKIEISELNETLIIALLRLSFVWKNDISSWKEFLNKSVVELEKRGHNSKKLLVGLI